MPLSIVCIDCRKPSQTSPCTQCKAIRAKSRNKSSFYQSPRWKTLRAQAKATYGNACYLCGSTKRVTFHHLQPREQGGPDTVENLRPLCGSCHSQYEADARAAKTTPLTQIVGALAKEERPTVIAIVGIPATGKSHARQVLAKHLKLKTFAIDDYRAKADTTDQAWSELLQDLYATQETCIVESNAAPGDYRLWLKERKAYVIRCSASPDKREQRLRKRMRAGELDYRTMRLMLDRQDVPLPANLKYDTTHATKERDLAMVAAVARILDSGAVF